MIYCNTEYISSVIIDQQFKHCKIYEGVVKENNTSCFAKYDCNSPEELQQKIIELSKQFGSKWTIFLRRHNGGTDASLTRLNWDTTSAKTPENNNNNNTTDVAALRSQILQELKVELRVKELEYEVESKNAQLAELNTNSGKLALIGLQMLQGFGLIRTNNAVMNGTQSNAQGSVKDVKQATETLLNLFGEEDYILLSDKLANNPQHVQFVKQFLKS